MSLIFKNDARSFAMHSLCGFLSKIIDTPVNGRPSFFRIDSAHKENCKCIAWRAVDRTLRVFDSYLE
jgi:hypothetical protein